MISIDYFYYIYSFARTSRFCFPGLKVFIVLSKTPEPAVEAFNTWRSRIEEKRKIIDSMSMILEHRTCVSDTEMKEKLFVDFVVQHNEKVVIQSDEDLKLAPLMFRKAMSFVERIVDFVLNKMILKIMVQFDKSSCRILIPALVDIEAHLSD